MDRKRLRVQILWSLLLALLVYIALVLYGDWRLLSTRLTGFSLASVPVALGLTLVSFGIRLLKWRWYLGLIDAPISFGDSARIFGLGFLMVMTPGKAGEFLRALMVRNVCGTPFSVVAPIVLAERITDGFAMILLASLGLMAIDDAAVRLAAAAALLGIVVIIVAIQVRPLANLALGVARRAPLARRIADKLATFYESSYQILQPKYLLPSVLFGLVSWGIQGLAFYRVALEFGLQAEMGAMLTSVSVFNISTVVGAVVATPGGLGGVESSLAALSMNLLGLDRSAAAAAALVIRLATLWFSVAIGLVSLALWPRLLLPQEGRGESEKETVSEA